MTSKHNDGIDESADKIATEYEIAGVVKRLLQLEKDLALPDIQVTDTVRVERIMDAIEREKF
jgi:hypothetical protein